MELIGYADRLSVAPGEVIRFHVSCVEARYEVALVRLVHGDPNPRGPGFKQVPIPSEADGTYPGRKQVIRTGSYVLVEDDPRLRLCGGFTLQAWVLPTTPLKGEQGILTKWWAGGHTGYGLFLDADGGLALWIGDAAGACRRYRSASPMRPGEWYFVAAAFDAHARKVSLYQEPLSSWANDSSRSVTMSAAEGPGPGENDAPLLMAACADRDEGGRVIAGFHFNGKIDRPRVFRRALRADEMDSLKGGAAPEAVGEGLVGAWDFSADMDSTRARDRSANGLDGRAVNMPARATTGYNWTGEEADFRLAPGQYGAIHFHDDDLEDAAWEVDFALTVPGEWRSGVYAARLRAGTSEDYIPFFVRPQRGKPTAPILFLAPTNSYLAYANEHMTPEFVPHAVAPFQKMEPVGADYRYILDSRLSSLYDTHCDGSGICYSSRLRPILNFRPRHYLRMMDAPHQFAADLHLIDWLEAQGYHYDVVTDENLHFEGTDLLASYRVVLTGTHPEYWSGTMLAALEGYLRQGGRLMYLGGNGLYWVTSFHPECPHVIEVRRWGGTQAWAAAPGEYYHSTTGELGGLWRNRGKAPQKLVGVGFTAQGLDRNAPYHRLPGSHDPSAAFIFEGVGPNDLIGDFPNLVLHHGAAGFELDRLDPALGSPPHALLLASSSGYSDAYQHVIEETLVMLPAQGGKDHPLVKADMVYFETPNGGAVFSVGSIAWCGCLSYNGYDNNVSRITGNVLQRFVSEKPLS